MKHNEALTDRDRSSMLRSAVLSSDRAINDVFSYSKSALPELAQHHPLNALMI